LAPPEDPGDVESRSMGFYPHMKLSFYVVLEVQSRRFLKPAV
jgi:hypothetical protein